MSWLWGGHQEVSFLISLILHSRSFFFFSACPVQTPIMSMQLFFFWLTLTDIVVLSFFLSFFHSFFLPVAWAIDLAVQGCKYHCGFFSFAPLNFYTCSPTHPSIHSSLHASSHRCMYIFSCWGLCCMKYFTRSCPPTSLPYMSLWAVTLLMRRPYFCLIAIRKSHSVIVIALCTPDS